jgi:DNA repair photolyase
MSIIYEPTGAAREYSELALNLYKGCAHGCIYCFGANTTWLSAEKFHEAANPKKNVIARIRKAAKKLNQNQISLPFFKDSSPPKEILLSFISDPYQPIENNLKLTREAIKILIENNLTFTILTKGGSRAQRDFALLKKYSKCSFGTTLVFSNQDDADYWEPSAAPIIDRIKTIELAHSLGIKTWVSVEPVIDPNQALQIIKELHSIVDHWKVGKINDMPKIEKTVNWIKFKKDVIALLDSLKADYYIKKSLTEL